MKRFRRWLLDGLAVLSLLLCVATLMAWALGHERRSFYFSSANSCRCVVLDADPRKFGTFRIGLDMELPAPATPLPNGPMNFRSWGGFGFYLHSEQTNFGGILAEPNGDWVGPNELQRQISVELPGDCYNYFHDNSSIYLGCQTASSQLLLLCQPLQHMWLRPSRDTRPMPGVRNNPAEKGNNFKLNQAGLNGTGVGPSRSDEAGVVNRGGVYRF